jgi:hypothetical protein|tara:strand:- start:2049 stop:3164 length:1116 start_codon:yes stop_codon:yes gene_type:complete
MALKAFKALQQSAMNTGISKALGHVQGLVSGAKPFAGGEAKQAAQLLKKSPMEIPDSPQEKLKRNPLTFNTCSYPLDLGSAELGHYIIFYVGRSLATQSYDTADFSNSTGLNSSEPGKSTTQKARNSKSTSLSTSGSIDSRLPGSYVTSGAISIYMPPGIKVSYGQGYETEATNLSGDLFNAIDNANAAEDASGKIGAILDGVVGGTGKYAKQLATELVSMAGAGDPVRIMMKRKGIAINPREEQFYNAPDFRGFEYVFDFWPRSQKELEEVDKIIWMFKYHSAPGYQPKGQGGSGYFATPNKFEISYMHNGGANDYLNKIASCYCTKVDVDYGPEGQTSFFTNGAPVHYKLSLSFVEDQYITKDLIAAGY